MATIFMVASAYCGLSQTRSVEHEFSPFDAIEASDGFKVSITQSDRCSARLTIDDALESYVQCYVKAGVLHVELDEKSIPKDLKKQYRGRKSSDPTLVVMVYLPSLKSLTLNDDSQFLNTTGISADKFTLNMGGTAAISNLKLTAGTVEVTLSKGAKLTNANFTVTGDLNITCDGKSDLTLEYSVKNLNLVSAGSADVVINGTVSDGASISLSGSSETSISGSAGSLEIGGKGGSAKLDASSLKVDTVTVATSGATVDVAPGKTLELDLGRGAEVNYSGDPVIKIVKIVSSSVTRK